MFETMFSIHAQKFRRAVLDELTSCKGSISSRPIMWHAAAVTVDNRQPSLLGISAHPLKVLIAGS